MMMHGNILCCRLSFGVPMLLQCQDNILGVGLSYRDSVMVRADGCPGRCASSVGETSNALPSGYDYHSHGKWPIYRWFTSLHIKNGDFPWLC